MARSTTTPSTPNAAGSRSDEQAVDEHADRDRAGAKPTDGRRSRPSTSRSGRALTEAHRTGAGAKLAGPSFEEWLTARAA